MAESAHRQSRGRVRVWPDDGREVEIHRVAGILADPHSAGAVVLGDQGVGKTWVAGKALAAVEADVYTLRATPLTSQVPLGALGPLLTHLNERPPDALTALHLLGRHFDSLGPDHRPIVYVSRAQHLDDSSAMVLGQLVVGGCAKLLATSGPGVHQELTDLIDDDAFSIVRLSGLPPPEVKRIIRSYLGSQVSARTEAAVVGAVNGNPSCLRVLLDELLASGTLVQRAGVWVLTRPVIQDWIHPGGLQDACARLARLPDRQRDVLEMVAVCEPITWALLSDAASPDQIDELVDMGLLTVSGKPATVTFQQTVFGEALRQSVPANRRLDIRARLNTHVDRAQLPYPRLAGFVNLDLACGQPVPLADAMTIAKVLLSSDRAASALTVLDAADPGAGPGGQWVDWQLLRASALVDVAGLDAGRKELDKLCQREDLTAGAFVEAHTRMAEVAWAAGDVADTERVMDRTARGLGGYPAGPARAAASRRLAVDRLHLAVHSRRYADSVEPLQEVFADADLETDLRVKAGKDLAESALMTGRLSLSLDTAGWVTRTLESVPGLPMTLYWQGGTVALAVFLEANQWSTATALVDRVMDRAGRFPVLAGGVTDMAQGAALLPRGQIRAALEHLESCVATFEAFDHTRMYPHAVALAGSAYAALGDHQRAGEYLERAEALLDQTSISGHVATEVELQVLTARLWMGDASAHDDLTDFAAQMHQNRIPMAEMHALFALARAGVSSVLADLITTTRRVEGEYARIIGIYAEAKLANDPGGFAAAAERAERSGRMLLAAGLAAEGLSAIGPAEGGDTPRLRNSLHVLINRCRQTCGDVGDVPFRTDDALPETLTPREREIARHVVAGRSNREIADALTVSVRTIEGHLYRIYPKLGVTRRGELNQIIDM